MSKRKTCPSLAEAGAEVLAVRVKVYRAVERWSLLRAVAKQLAGLFPDEPR